MAVSLKELFHYRRRRGGGPDLNSDECDINDENDIDEIDEEIWNFVGAETTFEE